MTYRARPDIRPIPRHADFGRGKIHFTPGSILGEYIWNKSMIQYGYYGVSKYGKCLYGSADTVTQEVLANLYDANTMLAANADATPLPLTIAEQRIIGRITAGNIAALTGAQILTILTGQAGAAFSWNGQALNNVGEVTAQNSIWYREQHLPAFSVSPGTSGATLTPPGATTVGGYQLDVNTEYLYFTGHVHGDWDAASDLEVQVVFEVNVNNTGGLVTDTVDLQLVCRMRGDGETVMKTQTLEVARTVGQSAQYKQFETDFTIDYNDGSNPVDSGDLIGFVLNLETDTSEVDDIIVNHITFRYKTKKPAPEVTP